MAQGLIARHSGARIPDARGVVARSRDDTSPIGTKLPEDHPTLVTQRFSDWPQRLRIPQARSAILARREEQPAVRTELGVPHWTRMNQRLVERLPCGRIPEARDAILARRHQSASIRTKGQRGKGAPPILK